VLKAAGAAGSRNAFGIRQQKQGFHQSMNNALTLGRCYTLELLDGETLATLNF